MKDLEKNTVKLVAKVAPWLAPLPSAFFVARASTEHLTLPLAVAVVVATVIETLGISTVHTALWLSDWNGNKRKTDPSAPTLLAIILGAVYVAATVGLTIVLEVAPSLSTFAPALFPALAVVGAVNLALISQQERREGGVKAEKARRKAERKAEANRQATVTKLPSGTSRVERKARRSARLDALLTLCASRPDIRATEAGQVIGVSRQTIYTYLAELEADGHISRGNGTIKVLKGVTHD